MEFWHLVIIAAFVFAYALMISINSTHKKHIALKIEHDHLSEKYDEKVDLIGSLRIVLEQCRNDKEELHIEIAKLQYELHFLKEEIKKNEV